jgi:hypothetical protein
MAKTKKISKDHPNKGSSMDSMHALEDVATDYDDSFIFGRVDVGEPEVDGHCDRCCGSGFEPIDNDDDVTLEADCAVCGGTGYAPQEEGEDFSEFFPNDDE